MFVRTRALPLLVIWVLAGAAAGDMEYDHHVCRPVGGTVFNETGTMAMRPPPAGVSAILVKKSVGVQYTFNLSEDCKVDLLRLRLHYLGNCSARLSFGSRTGDLLTYPFRPLRTGGYALVIESISAGDSENWLLYQRTNDGQRNIFHVTVYRSQSQTICGLSTVHPRDPNRGMAVYWTASEDATLRAMSINTPSSPTDRPTSTWTASTSSPVSALPSTSGSALPSASSSALPSTSGSAIPSTSESETTLVPAVIAALISLILLVLICVFCMVRSGKVLRTSNSSFISFIQTAYVKTEVTRTRGIHAATADYTIDPVIYSSAGPCYVKARDSAGKSQPKAPVGTQSQGRNPDALQCNGEAYATVASAFDNRPHNADIYTHPATSNDATDKNLADLDARHSKEKMKRKSSSAESTPTPNAQSGTGVIASQANATDDLYALPHKKERPHILHPHKDDSGPADATDTSFTVQKSHEAKRRLSMSQQEKGPDNNPSGIASQSLPIPKPAPYRVSKAVKENAGQQNAPDHMMPIDEQSVVDPKGAATSDDINLPSSPHREIGNVEYMHLELHGGGPARHSKPLTQKSASGASCIYSEVKRSE